MFEGPPAPQQPPRFVTDLDTLIRARYPLVYLVSYEEQRLDAILAELAQTHAKALFSWSVTRGLRRVGARTLTVSDGSRGPVDALQTIAKLSEPSLVVLKDFHAHLHDATVVRALRELAQDLKSTLTTVILLSPVLRIPTELEKEVTVLDVPLPTFRDLFGLLREIVAVVRQGNKARVDLTKEQAEALIRAAQGLTLSEAENAFAKAIANDGVLDKDDVRLVMEEKRQVVRKSGVVEFVNPDATLADVGGLDALKGWLSERAGAFGEPARRFGLPAPRGVLLLGMHGCGKSLCAKATASAWNLPLLRLEDGDGKAAAKLVESVGPVVLWLDEVEKVRNVTALLDRGAFVVATANDLAALPPELLRRGRFDEIFFVDLPSDSERREILRIHLEKRQRDPLSFDLEELAAQTPGFSGSELEHLVVSALFAAFAEGAELTQQHLTNAVASVVPLSATMGEELARLREWAKQRCRRA